jgi:hypothetical protein
MPTKCDWSKVGLKEYNQNNYFKYQLTGVDRDSCTNFLFTIVDRQTKKLDTVQDFNGFCQIQFNKKGKYYLRIPIYNTCTKCDTVIYREINIRYFPGASASWKGKDDDCDQVVFEMANLKDTCIEYYYYYYSGRYFDTMSTKHWNELTDYEINMEYSFPDADFIDYGQARVWKDTFSKRGRYLLIAQFYDKCLNQDTFMYRKFTTCDSVTSSIKTITGTKPEPKLVAMYDMLGRPVHNARENEVVIYLFSDGTTRKVVKK